MPDTAAWTSSAFLALQVASGLFSETKEDFAGPLSTGYHKRVGQWVLITLLALHIAAIAFYSASGRGLVCAMFHGGKKVTDRTPVSRDDWRTRIIAVLVMSLCSLVMWGITKLGK